MEILGIRKIVGDYEKEQSRKKSELAYRERMKKFNKNHEKEN